METGSKELPLIEGLQVYPNPTTDIIYLRRHETDENLFISLSGQDGIVVHEKMWVPGDEIVQLRLKDYAVGIYILSIVNQENTKGSRFKVLKM